MDGRTLKEQMFALLITAKEAFKNSIGLNFCN
jgi:hypothetical protein